MSHIALRATLRFQSGVIKVITCHYPYRVIPLSVEQVKRELTNDFLKYAKACDDELLDWKMNESDWERRIKDASALRLPL